MVRGWRVVVIVVRFLVLEDNGPVTSSRVEGYVMVPVRQHAEGHRPRDIASEKRHEKQNS
ncbi:MAG: hypothetical protein H7066_14460 [Cytophagaceae bacterium]|nr:hypothetical protein [Gemmatimonadaceae bacterium]